MIKILLSIYLLLSSFVLFAQGLFENDPIWRDEFNRDNVPSSMYWSYIVGMRGQESEYYTNSSNNVLNSTDFYTLYGNYGLKCNNTGIFKTIDGGST